MRRRFIAASLAVHAGALAVAGALVTAPAPPPARTAALQVRLPAPAPAPVTVPAPRPAHAVPTQAAAPPPRPQAAAVRSAAAAPPTPAPPAPDRAPAGRREPAAAPAGAAPPPAARADSAPPAGSLELAERTNHLRSAVLSVLAPTLTYPPLARKYGWQGRVLVDVELAADGRLQPLRIARSSGYRLLDNHAFDALRRIGDVPQAHRWLGGHSYAFAVPVTYRLIDG